MMRLIHAAFAVAALGWPVASFPQQNLPLWSLEPELRIGEVDGPSALPPMGSVTVSPTTGAIFVAVQGNNVMAFDREGRYQTTFVREGDGPGEVRYLNDIFWLDGHVVVLDTPSNRVIRFSEDGAHVGTRRLELGPISAPAGRIHPIGVLGSNGYLASAQESSYGDRTLIRAEAAGGEQLLDRLRSSGPPIPLPPLDLVMGAGMNRYSLRAPHPHGQSAVIVHQDFADSDNGTFRVRRLAASGEVIYARNYVYAPRRLPADYAESIGDRMNFEAAGITPARGVAAVVDAFEKLGLVYEMPVSEVLLARDGSVWLRREDIQLEQITWWVLNPFGDLVGELRLPRRVRIKYVDGDTVWASDTDELGVDYLVRYAIRKQ
jgi:hypothetical protein